MTGIHSSILAGVGFAVGGVCGAVCYWVAGDSLDLFIGGVFMIALLVPPFSAIGGRSAGTWVCAVAICLGVGCNWVVPVHAQVITVGQWLICMAVLLSFAALLTAAVEFLIGFSLSPVVASGVVTIAGLAWLSWPVWLSASLAGRQLHGSVAIHPLFAINRVVANLGIWTEQQVAYGLTNLGQDVQYQLPNSAWLAVGAQAGLAIVMYVGVRFQKVKVK